MKKTAVRLHFEGSVIVNVLADPNSDEAWVDAIGDKWEDVGRRQLKEAAILIDHEIIETD